jgi:hypothetical protein
MPVLDRPDARADPELYGMALVMTAQTGRFIGIATARRLAGQAVDFARGLDGDRVLVNALAVLSSVCYFGGEPERGLAFGQEAVERARPLDDDVLLAQCIWGRRAEPMG